MDPFEEMRRMQEDMDRMFRKTANIASFGKTRQPMIDMLNKSNEIIVIAELPGVEKEEIEIDVKPFMLSISAESRHMKEKQREGYYFKERSASKFQRALSLPEEVTPEKTEAEFKNGILEIKMPKKHFIRRADKGRKIHIK